MRYADLHFELHGFLTAAQVATCRQDAGELEKTFDAFMGYPTPEDRIETPVVIERALATFPNGRSISVLRGLQSTGLRGNYETCRLEEGALAPIRHWTIESVEQEMDAVAALQKPENSGPNGN